MTYTATFVANNILNRAFAEKLTISPMKLQKILYFMASEYQKESGHPLFSEQFETWQYGPVLRSIYGEFRPFSRSYITRFAKDAENKSLMIDEKADPILRRVIDRVWSATKERSAVDLSRITHLPDSAWDLSFQNKQPFLSSTNIATDKTYQHELGLVAS